MKGWVIGGALAASTIEAAACEWPRRWFFRWGQTSEVLVKTRSGQPCGASIGVSNAPIDQVRVTSRPRGGVAGVNTISVAYRPNDGFVGRDEFVFEVHSRLGRRGAPETAAVRVIVTVTP